MIVMKPVADRIIEALKAATNHRGTCPDIYNSVNRAGGFPVTKDGFEETCQDLHDKDRVIYRPIPNPLQPMGTLELSRKERQYWILEILAKHKSESEAIDLESVRQKCGFTVPVFMDHWSRLLEAGHVEPVGEIETSQDHISGACRIRPSGKEALREFKQEAS